MARTALEYNKIDSNQNNDPRNQLLFAISCRLQSKGKDIAFDINSRILQSFVYKDGRTAPGVCGNGSVPLSHSGNVVTRIVHFQI